MGIHVVRVKAEGTGHFNLGKKSLRGRGWSVSLLSSAAMVRIFTAIVRRRTRGNGHISWKGELTRYVETFLLLEEVVQYWNRCLGRLGNCQLWTNSEVT